MSVPYPEFKEELDKRVPGLDSKPLMDLIGEPKGEVKKKIRKEELASDTYLSGVSGVLSGLCAHLWIADILSSISLPISAAVGSLVAAGVYNYTRSKDPFGGGLIPKKEVMNKRELELHEPEEWKKPYTPENIADQVAEKKLEELI